MQVLARAVADIGIVMNVAVLALGMGANYTMNNTHVFLDLLHGCRKGIATAMKRAR